MCRGVFFGLLWDMQREREMQRVRDKSSRRLCLKDCEHCPFLCSEGFYFHLPTHSKDQLAAVEDD
ncbi:uncharacterized, partial [Tachysurus ichikawai]